MTGQGTGSALGKDRQDAREVWAVWTESGEYEDWSRDLAGLFSDRAAARSHADALQAQRESLDVVEIKRETVLATPPEPVTYYRWSAHITEDGQEDKGLGYYRESCDGWWSHDLRPARGRLVRWSGDRAPDLYIEVTGHDLQAVRAKYDRLLQKARRRLARRNAAAQESSVSPGGC